MYLTEQAKPQKPEQTLFKKSGNDEPGLAQTGRLSCGRKVPWEDFHSSSQQSRTSGGPMGSARLAACTCQNSVLPTGDFLPPHVQLLRLQPWCVCPPCKSTGQSKSNLHPRISSRRCPVSKHNICAKLPVCCVAKSRREELAKALLLSLGCRERKPG